MIRQAVLGGVFGGDEAPLSGGGGTEQEQGASIHTYA